MYKLALTFSLSLILFVSAGVAQADFSLSITPKAPHKKYTPGHLCDEKNEDFYEHRYEEEVPYCIRNVSFYQRTLIYEKYKIAENRRADYTIDHLIPLSIGGSNEPENLWPEHKEIKALRPYLEVEVFLALKDGRITQKEAIELILEAKLNPPLVFH